MEVEGLIDRLKWALSVGVKHVHIYENPDGYKILTGKTSNGTIQQVYPMSDEERGYKKPFVSKKDKKTVNNDTWKYSERDSDFDDDDYFGSENSWNESVKDKRVIKLTEKDLANLVKRVIKEQRK